MAIIGGKKKGFFGKLSERISDTLMSRATVDDNFRYRNGYDDEDNAGPP